MHVAEPTIVTIVQQRKKEKTTFMSLIMHAVDFLLSLNSLCVIYYHSQAQIFLIFTPCNILSNNNSYIKW